MANVKLNQSIKACSDKVHNSSYVTSKSGDKEWHSVQPESRTTGCSPTFSS